MSGTPCPRYILTGKCRWLWILALGCSFRASMTDWTVSVLENGRLSLTARSDCSRRRTLGGVHSIVDRMQRSACPFDHFGRNCPLHGTTGMHGTADAARNKQPGEETHLYPQAKERPYTKTTLAGRAPTWIMQSQVIPLTRLSTITASDRTGPTLLTATDEYVRFVHSSLTRSSRDALPRRRSSCRSSKRYVRTLTWVLVGSPHLGWARRSYKASIHESEQMLEAAAR